MCARVRHDQGKVRRVVEGTASLSGPEDSDVYYVTRRVVAAGAKGLVVLAFSGYMCARVRLVTEWAFIYRDVVISFGQFTVLELTVDDFEKGGSLLEVVC